MFATSLEAAATSARRPEYTMAGAKQRVSRAKLKGLIAKSFKHGTATLPSIASKLKVSTRSLQRDLAHMNVNYSELVDEVREEKAKELLAGDELGIAEIGAALGYRDPSSFSRAFMRWMRMSPRDYRATVRQRGRSKPGIQAL
jgi:AraC-like DNA-binding protein